MKKDNRYIAFKLLEQYFESNLYINDIISNYFDKNNLETSDKNFINNLVLGIVRMKGKYDYIFSSIYHGNYKKIKNKIRYILYIGSHQIEEMDSIPDHAAISTTVDIAKSLFPGLDRLVNALLRNFISFLHGSHARNQKLISMGPDSIKLLISTLLLFKSFNS